MPGALRRRQLLDVALEAFAAGGYHDTSMEEIADAAGVTKPVLYQHFRSKQELYLELIETVGRGLVADIESKIAASDSAYHRVLAGFRAYFEFVADRTSAFRLVFGSGARGTEEFADAIQALESELAETVARYIDAGIDDQEREMFGYAIVGLAEVTSRRWVAEHGGEGSPAQLDLSEADQLATDLADLLWAGLRALPATGVRARSSIN